MKFLLRSFEKEDAQNIAKSADNPNIAKYLRNSFPNPYTLEDANWYINDCICKEGKNQIVRAISVDEKSSRKYRDFCQRRCFRKISRIRILAFTRLLEQRYYDRSRQNNMQGSFFKI